MDFGQHQHAGCLPVCVVRYECSGHRPILSSPATAMNAIRTIILCAWLGVVPAQAQTNGPVHQGNSVSFTPTNQLDYLNHLQAVETVRADCIQSRRIICGRILKVLPSGLVVDSGYTSLMRHPLDRSWLVPSTVQAEREPNLVEKNEPDCVCAGLVFVT